MMKILGINYETHESSVTLIEDGRVLFSAAEERYSRLKMDTSAPVLTIKECLRYTGIKPEDIDIISISGFRAPQNWYYYAKSFILEKLFTNGKAMLFVRFTIGNKEIVLRWILAIVANLLFLTGLPQLFYLSIFKKRKIKNVLQGFKGKYVYVSHHLCHASSACFTSGHDRALSIVIEGMDWESTLVIDEFEKGKFKRISKTKWPHSPGYFYILITSILGYNYLRHSGKITGLAAYGNHEKPYKKVADLMWNEGLELKLSPKVYTLIQEYYITKKIPDYFEGFSKEDLASAFQKRLEDVIVDIVKLAVIETGIKKIVLSGGVAANVLMNQRILQNCGVEEIFIHPAMSDSGQAFGAAAFAYNEYLQDKGSYYQSKKINNVYLGTDYSNEEIKKSLNDYDVEFVFHDEIEKEIAKQISNKKVVARFNGRMEYGPRSLGNRSVLCHGGDKSINDWLNKRLKRTEFMPFAPSALYEDRKEYFINFKGAENAAEFMTITFDCTDKMKQLCPAAVHIDGTARPHFVLKDENPSFHKIISEYKKLTGIGVLLNTSFNMHEEPIVCSPDDAIRSFLQGQLDYLAIGNYLVKRPNALDV